MASEFYGCWSFLVVYQGGICTAVVAFPLLIEKFAGLLKWNGFRVWPFTIRTGRTAALVIEHHWSSQRLAALLANPVLGRAKGSQTPTPCPTPTPPPPLKRGANRSKLSYARMNEFWGQVRAKITAWRDEYNRERPHSSLGY